MADQQLEQTDRDAPPPVDVLLGHDGLTLELTDASDRPAALAAAVVGGRRLEFSGREVPLIEVLSPTYGHAEPVHRLAVTELGRRLRPVGPAGPSDRAAAGQLVVADPDAGIEVTLAVSSRAGSRVLTATTTVRNTGADPLVLTAVPSLQLPLSGTLDGRRFGIDDLTLHDATGEWVGESRWQARPLRDLLPELRLDGPRDVAKGVHGASSRGTWSTADALPMGVLTAGDLSYAVAWQIEHNGAWRWELAQNQHDVQLTLSGPTDLDHGWLEILQPGESFTGVPVSVAFGSSLDDALGELTTDRRARRRPHRDNSALTLIYNDYMNTLWGDPTTEKLLPLIDEAARAGAEVFCIDAGWYDDTGHWWDGVGAWQPSTVRFPGGLDEVLDAIRERGMVPGLWLEPEVVGVRSPIADQLPDEAFFRRGGVRVREAGRYQLDLRHPAARAHLDEVIDRLVGDAGVGMFKMDYNINPGVGTDRDADSVGAGLLAHNRAVLAWIDGVLDRHPDLIVENCGSGAMRMDQAMLSRLQLQSTTDQWHLAEYAPIAVAAPMMMLPEQVGSWAYPGDAMDDEETAFSLSLGMLGRLYLSGLLDRVRPQQRALVAEAVRVHKDLRTSIPHRLPIWPLGLPAWTAPWLAIGLTGRDDLVVTVFRREGGEESVELALPAYAGAAVDVEVLFPVDLPAWRTAWDEAAGTLRLTASGDASAAARTYRITPH